MWPAVLDSQVIWSGVIAGLVTVVTLVIKTVADRRTSRDQHRHTDRELLSMDEHRFRETLIKELTACRDSHDKIEKECDDHIKDNVTKDRLLARKDWQIERLCFELKKAGITIDPSICETEIRK